jgi:hypothetical protein
VGKTLAIRYINLYKGTTPNETSLEEQSFDEAVNSRKGFSRTGEELEKEQSFDSLTPQGDKSRD